MTHFVNQPADIVTSALDALLRASGGRLTRLDGYPDTKVVLRADLSEQRVAVISGGGAGHEPAHAGFVGPGLLTAAVSGEIFASPSVAAVLAAIRAVTGPAGCLLIVKNYTGDRLNFGLAAEQARAGGIPVEMVMVADDVALPEAPQPRGIAGTLLVHKVAGAAAEAGAPLAEVTAQARRAAEAVRSLGVSVSGANIPFRQPARDFPPATAELGLGIHGEPGAQTVELATARELVTTMAERLAHELPPEAPLAVLVNNLGGTSMLELGVISNDLLATPLGQRTELIIGPAPLMTSLSMKGFSISALPLDGELRDALLYPVGYHGAGTAWPGAHSVSGTAVRELPDSADLRLARPSDHAGRRQLLTSVCAAVRAHRDELDQLDARVGDGDTGSTFAAAADRIMSELDALPLAEPAALLSALGRLISAAMGGSSGVLLSIGLTAAGTALEQGADLGGGLAAGVAAMQRYGGARPGDRTMLDALIPAITALQAGRPPAMIAAAAQDGARRTAELDRAAAGRSAYVPAAQLAGVIDPGAQAIAVIIHAAVAAPN